MEVRPNDGGRWTGRLSSKNSSSRSALEVALAAAMRKARERAEHEQEQYQKLHMLMLFELERLKRQLFGKKAEAVHPKRLAFDPLFDAFARPQTGDTTAHDHVQSMLAKLWSHCRKVHNQVHCALSCGASHRPGAVACCNINSVTPHRGNILVIGAAQRKLKTSKVQMP